MLDAQHIAKSYPTRSGDLVVLREVTLQVAAGAAATIVGPSGAGKSTLLNILGTLEPPTAGMLRIGGEDPFALPERELARFRNRRIGFVFQDHHLLPQCTVMENVLLPTLVGPDDSSTMRIRARSLLEKVGLGQRLDHRPAELSGGERQRVSVVRALIHKPALVLADEPTGNLDSRSGLELITLFRTLNCEGRSIVLVTHDANLARMAGRVIEIVDGKIVA